jgi:hypothetical protein
MLNLASTSDLVQLVTTAAVACHVQASWVDIVTATGAVTPGRTNTIVSTATTTTVVAAPASGSVRNLKHLSVHAIGGANTVTVQHTDGTTAVNVQNAALLGDESLMFNDGVGFQVLDASGALKMAAQPQAGRYIKTTVYASGAANHTTDPKTATIFVRLIGGGGGGGGAVTGTTAASCGAGGGAGGYAEKTFTVSPSTAYAYSVGAAGTAGANTGAAGGNGGNSTFIVGGTTVTAFGGTGGGGGGTAATTALVTAGGNGGVVSTNGDLNGSGMPGEDSYRVSGTFGWSGNGGSSALGGGGNGLAAAGTGATAAGPGGGGSGGSVLNGSASVLGGAGKTGLIVVDEFT